MFLCGMNKQISLIALVALGIGALFLATNLAPALGAASPNSNGQNGFGVAASQFATSCPAGSVGTHASSGPTPHQGIGEIANGMGISVGQLGTALNALRGTNCSPAP